MYHSTRGKKKVSSSTAILEGLAKDGGLYVTDAIPKLSYKEVLDLSYPELAAKILQSFFTEFKYEEILNEVREAYQCFDVDEVVSLKHFEKESILELFHGPTGAFKDIALVVLPRMMKLAKQKRRDFHKTTILTATSGDTGGATLSGFKNVEGIEVIVLYPTNGVSSLQEAQMQSFNCDNGHVVAVEGNFDECQTYVKKFFLKREDLHLSSANSINIARLVPQIVYYYYSYIALMKEHRIKENEKVHFVVPTGNFGDILAGYLAKQMGLPIDKLICASNENKVLTDFFTQKVYDANRTFYKTNSPSMDIIISSNLERLLYYETKSTYRVRHWMKLLNKKKKYRVKHDFNDFVAFSCSKEETLHTIKRVYTKQKYLVDPHTAVAIHALEEFRKTNTGYAVVLSTASPLKFSSTVLEAIHGERGEIVELCKHLEQEIPTKFCYPSFSKQSVSLEHLDEKIKEIISCYTLK